LKLRTTHVPRIAAILIAAGLLALVLSLATYARSAVEEVVPADVTQVPVGPPEILPDFSPTESVTASSAEKSPSAPSGRVPTVRPPTAQTATPVPPASTPRQSSRPPAESPPTRIVATSIHLDSTVVPVGWVVDNAEDEPRTVWEVPHDAAGWHINSAYPGNGGNVVLSGHNNIAGEVFRDLIDLKNGDVVQLHVEDRIYYYEVTGKLLIEEKGMPLEVRRENARWIAPTDHERLTLVSCWPYSTYTHRLIIIAKPVSQATVF
jgi:sortase A